jgi:hypothetical protein
MFHIPMSSPMMTMMFGFLAWADAGEAGIAMAASIASANGIVVPIRLKNFIQCPLVGSDPAIADVARRPKP